MPYIVNFTDSNNKTPITVYDNTSNADTSLNFPGRNVTGYGRIIAENFLALLENFSSTNAPANPVEGQLWFDSSSGKKTLMIWDNVQWKAASNIQKSTTQPSIENSQIGELWVDTANQQLYVYSGFSWILVGPSFSTGLRSGPVVESITDSDNLTRAILTFYIEDKPIIIISKDSFTPKNSITGFITIKTGVNITTDTTGFDGGYAPKFYGTAVAADSLNVGGAPVAAAKFLRSDTVNTTEQAFNIRNNSGLTIGIDGTFSVTASTSAAKLYNATPGSSIDFQTNKDGVANTVLKVINSNIGVNVPSPAEAVDISGNLQLDGTLILTGTAESTNFNSGTIRTAGGVAISKNLLVGTSLNVSGQTITTSIEPSATEKYDSGSLTRRWNTVRAKTIIADTIVGALEGSIIGNATTATNLRYPTTFKMQGDVTSATLTFDGQTGGTTKIFDTVITSGIISNKLEPSPNKSEKTDYILTFRQGQGLLKQSRDVFVADLGVPIGAIMPYAGATAPAGYLMCDGGEVEITKYRDLYNVIGNTYGNPLRGATGLTFVLPDLRGRFPLGKHNMDNANSVPIVGGFVDAGGGLPSSEVFTAGAFVAGRSYTIATLGNTNWTAAGVPAGTTAAVGTVFVATTAGSGTGTASYTTRVDDLAASTLGGVGGQNKNTLTKSNIPQHEHTMQGPSGNQYYATRLDTASPANPDPAKGSFLGRGPTTPGQMQYLPASGGIKLESGDGTQLGQSFPIMNPYLTLNYIIRSGPPIF